MTPIFTAFLASIIATVVLAVTGHSGDFAQTMQWIDVALAGAIAGAHQPGTPIVTTSP